MIVFDTMPADWLLTLSSRGILRAQVERIQREVADFSGVIDMWDVINEAVIMPVLDRYDTPVQRIGTDRADPGRVRNRPVGQSARDIVIERL
jgi:GH35 family endo-1,4-beta-xylanase